MSFLTPVWNYVDALVHPSVRHDALTAARHRAFIAPRLVGCFAALATFPIYLAFRGIPSMLEMVVFGWLVAPILIAYFLSRTGQFETAHILSALALTGLVGAVAWSTGGIGSFAAIWFVVVPVEAALSVSRRVVVTASMFVLGAVAVLALLAANGLPAPAMQYASHQMALVVAAIISAALYATGVALVAESMARKSFGLRNQEDDKYRLLAHNMTDVITRHGRAGAVLFASPAAETLFGTRAADLAGQGLFDRVHVADRPAYLSALSASATTGQKCSVEFKIRRDDNVDPRGNQFVWVEMRCQPLEHNPGDTTATERGVVAVLRDISDRKMQEHALDLARGESERANAAKSRFLATMSHELRTPLNAIIGFSDMLTDTSLLFEPARKLEYAKLINDSGHHLLSVVNGILDMSKMETGNFEITPEPFAPAQVVAGCCELLALKARDAGVSLTPRVAADLPEIMADRRAFNQILINLVSNAIKFTPRGGNVTVSVRRDGTRLAAVIEDTGVGIDEDDLPRVGEAFFQARSSYDRRHDGSGLGLSIVKGLVALHGGDIEIRSRLGEGTRVTVRLPIDREAAKSAADPIKLVTLRAGELAAAAKIRARKSA